MRNIVLILKYYVCHGPFSCISNLQKKALYYISPHEQDICPQKMTSLDKLGLNCRVWLEEEQG